MTEHPGLCVMVDGLSNVAFSTQVLGVSQRNVWWMAPWEQNMDCLWADEYIAYSYTMYCLQEFLTLILSHRARRACWLEGCSFASSWYVSASPTSYCYCLSSFDFIESVILIFCSVKVTDVRGSVKIAWLWITYDKYITYNCSRVIVRYTQLSLNIPAWYWDTTIHRNDSQNNSSHKR